MTEPNLIDYKIFTYDIHVMDNNNISDINDELHI